MKENIIDKIVQGVVFGAVAWFGLRGVIPDIIAFGYLPVLFSVGAAVIAGYAFGPYVYHVYRCAYRCDPTCEPKLCRAM